MPFRFLRRRRIKAGSPEQAAGRAPGAIPFHALTDEWHLVGQMDVSGRLSDVLNRREPIPISDVTWAPVDGS
ncbi:MAG: hypothetical protein ACJ767_07625, partial [Chloroflexota bacterium]